MNYQEFSKWINNDKYEKQELCRKIQDVACKIAYKVNDSLKYNRKYQAVRKGDSYLREASNFHYNAKELDTIIQEFKTLQRDLESLMKQFNESIDNRLWCLKQEISELTNMKQANEKCFKEMVAEKPSDLPSTEDYQKRINFVTTSKSHFKENYPDGWGRHAALQDLAKNSTDWDVWKQYKAMLMECWQNEDIEKAIDLTLGVGNGETEAKRKLKGLIAGLYDELTSDNKIKRWFLPSRLAVLLNADNDDWFKSRIKTHPNPYSLTHSDTPFEKFLEMYGEEKCGWENIILEKPSKT